MMEIRKKGGTSYAYLGGPDQNRSKAAELGMSISKLVRNVLVNMDLVETVSVTRRSLTGPDGQ